MYIPVIDRAKRVLLLEEFDDGLAMVVLRCLQMAGYEVHCLSGTRNTLLRRSRHCRVGFGSFGSASDTLASIDEYVAGQPVDLIVPIQESMIIATGTMLEQIKPLARVVHIPDPVMCRRMDNKWSFYELMSETGIRVPRTIPADTDVRGMRSELSTWGSQVMIKPTEGFGGFGIRLFERVDDLFETLEEGSASPEELIVQEFIPGHDVACSFLAFEGRIIAHTVYRQILHQAADFRSAGIGLEFVQDDQITAMATRFAESTNWSGVANLDLRIDRRTDERFLLEVNPRYWQTLLGSLAMGINFPDLHCRLSSGESPTPPSIRTGRWLNVHAVTDEPRNLAALVFRSPGLVRYIHWRALAADPQLELAAAARTLKRVARGMMSRIRRRFRSLRSKTS